MIRVSEIKLPLSHTERDIKLAVCKILRVREIDIHNLRIFKKSVDARKKNNIFFVYSVDVEVEGESRLLNSIKGAKISETPDYTYRYVKKGDLPMKKPPLIIGTGPAGLFAGLILAEMGYQPILIERGKKIDERVADIDKFITNRDLNPESNVVFGEGGAGTFSDGKLYTNIKDRRCRKVLEEFVKSGAPKEIIYRWKPHVGTDILRNVIKNMRQRIMDLGGKFYFRHKLTDLLIEDGRICGISLNNSKSVETSILVLAIGHSARDTFEMLYQKGVNMASKPFSIGLRIEHPQKLIDRIQYRRFADHYALGAAEYKLSEHFANGRSAYTFCMCPGGVVIPATSQIGSVVTNGMSEHARNGRNANSAILVGVSPEDFPNTFPLAGIKFQLNYEKKAFELGGKNYNAPVQLVGDFLKNRKSTDIGKIKPTYKPDYTLSDLSYCLPDYVVETLQKALISFDRKLKGFAMEEAVLTGVETRSSSPIRILRNENNESNIIGLYPTGEGAGYAGGIVSAAVDGIKTAEAIAKKLKPIATY